MATNNWKWMGVVLGGLLVVGGASLGNACGSDSAAPTGTGVIMPDGGAAGSATATTGTAGAGGGDTTSTTDTGGAGGAGGSAGGAGGAGGSTGGTGGAGGSAGTSMCPASGAFDNATRLKNLLGPDGGLPPL